MINVLVGFLLCLGFMALIEIGIILKLYKRTIARTFAALIGCFVFYAIGYGFELLSKNLQEILFWSKVQYIGLAFLPTIYITFTLQYIQKEKYLPKWAIYVLLAENFTTLIFKLTEKYHRLIYSQTTITDYDTFLVLNVTPGIWYWIHIAFLYIAALLAIVLFFQAWRKAIYLYRRQMGIMLMGAIVPFIGSAIYLAKLSLDGLDFSAISQGITIIFWTFGLLRYKLINLIPVAKEIVFDAMEEAVIILDAQDRIIDINPKAAAILKISRKTVIGKAINEISLYEEWKFTEILCNKEKTLDISIPTASGTRYFKARSSQLLDYQKRSIGEVILIVDISDLILMERAQQELQLQMSQLEKYEALGKFAGGIAHDFNNLLTVISGYIELLELSPMLEAENAPVPTIRQEFHETVGEIKDAAEKMVSLTGQILAFSKRQVLKKRQLNVNGSLVKLEENIRNICSPNIDVKITTNPQCGLIFADSTQIDQVILTFASNAKEFMPQGGILQISTESVQISSALAKKWKLSIGGEYNCLTISTNAQDIDPQLVDHIFEPFFSTNKKRFRTSLGLPMIEGIIRQHDGYIEVKNEKGTGLEFFVYLPVLDPRTEADTATITDLPLRSGRGIRVLVIEDDRAVLDFVEKILRIQDYRVETAQSAEEGVELFKSKKEPIHFIISDILLPGHSGVWAIEEILKIQSGLPYFLYSGFADSKELIAQIQKQGHPFLAKPFTSKAFLSKLQVELDKKGKPAPILSAQI